MNETDKRSDRAAQTPGYQNALISEEGSPCVCPADATSLQTWGYSMVWCNQPEEKGCFQQVWCWFERQTGNNQKRGKKNPNPEYWQYFLPKKWIGEEAQAGLTCCIEIELFAGESGSSLCSPAVISFAQSLADGNGHRAASGQVVLSISPLFRGWELSAASFASCPRQVPQSAPGCGSL